MKIFLTILLVFLVKESNAFKCYVCDDELESNCRDDPNPSQIRECETRYSPQSGEYNSGTGCSILISSYTEAVAVTKLERDCYYGNISLTPSFEEHGCKVSDPNKFFVKNCHICTGLDACNIEIFHSIEERPVVDNTMPPPIDNNDQFPTYYEPPSTNYQPPPVYYQPPPIYQTRPPSIQVTPPTFRQLNTIIKCYVCDEELDNDCRNKLKPSFIKNCQTAYSEQFRKYNQGTGCATLIRGFVLETNETVTKVQRDCYHGDINLEPSFHEYGCRTSNYHFSPLNCFTCADSDSCNNIPVQDED